jgi:PQQ-like domain
MIGTVKTPSNQDRRRLRIAIVVVSLAAAAVGSVLLATNGSGEKATTRGLTATLHLPGHPQFAVADAHALWVSTYGSTTRPNVNATGHLLRVDLADGTVQHSVRLAGQSSNVVRDGDRVIAASSIAGTSSAKVHGPGELIAVDWSTGRVLERRPQQIESGPLAVGDGALWAIQEKPTLLLKLSPTTLAPIAPPLALSRTSRVFGLSFGGGYLWASAGDDGDVLRIDPATSRITRTHVGGFPIGIVLEHGSVWVIDNAHDTVLRLDPRTLREIGKPVHTPSGGAFYLGATDGYVFIANDTDGTITRIDARSGQAAGPPIRIAPATHSTSASAAYAIAPAGGAIWATSDTTDTISRIVARP